MSLKDLIQKFKEIRKETGAKGVLELFEKLTLDTIVEKIRASKNNAEIAQLIDIIDLASSDNGLAIVDRLSVAELETKIFVNNEVTRLKESLRKAIEVEEIASDVDMMRKTNSVIQKLETFHNLNSLNESTLLTILKTQELVKEIYSNASQD